MLQFLGFELQTAKNTIAKIREQDRFELSYFLIRQHKL